MKGLSEMIAYLASDSFNCRQQGNILRSTRHFAEVLVQSHKQRKHGVIVKMEVIAAMVVVGGEEVTTSEDLVTHDIVQRFVIGQATGFEFPNVLDLVALVELGEVTLDTEDAVPGAEDNVLDLAVVGWPVSRVAGDRRLLFGAGLALAEGCCGDGEEQQVGGEEVAEVGRHVGHGGDDIGIRRGPL